MAIEKDLKREVCIETGMRFGRVAPSPVEVKLMAAQILESRLRQKRLELDAGTRELLLTAVCDDLLGFGPLDSLLRDDTITEIMVNGPERIYIERNGRKSLAETCFDDANHLRAILEKMLTLAGRRLDESSPCVDFSLKDGSRINAIITPLAVDGSTITIRKFLAGLNSMDDLVRLKTINEPMRDFLRAAIQAKLNIIFSGATGAGKTATLNVLSHEIAPDERIVTIEDALELKLNQKHVVRLLTRANNIEGKGAVSVRQLFSNTLRMRPSRIILGEIRGAEALDYLQATNSGHDGTLAALHASTPIDAIGRLETMAMYAGLELPASEIRRQIASGLNLIIQHEQLADGSRKLTYLTEVCGQGGNGEIILNDLFRFEVTGRAANGEITGEFKTVKPPLNLMRFKKRGIRLENLLQPAYD